MKSKQQIKDTYRDFPTHTLEFVVRSNSDAGNQIARDLANGTLQKRWNKVARKSGNAIDVTEKLREIAAMNDERIAVAEACRELLAERNPA